ncbi:hypothetical protein Tco_0317444 [Tanacetum coccineum]
MRCLVKRPDIATRRLGRRRNRNPFTLRSHHELHSHTRPGILCFEDGASFLSHKLCSEFDRVAKKNAKRNKETDFLISLRRARLAFIPAKLLSAEDENRAFLQNWKRSSWNGLALALAAPGPLAPPCSGWPLGGWREAPNGGSPPARLLVKTVTRERTGKGEWVGKEGGSNLVGRKRISYFCDLYAKPGRRTWRCRGDVTSEAYESLASLKALSE